MLLLDRPKGTKKKKEKMKNKDKKKRSNEDIPTGRRGEIILDICDVKDLIRPNNLRSSDVSSESVSYGLIKGGIR